MHRDSLKSDSIQGGTRAGPLSASIEKFVHHVETSNKLELGECYNNRAKSNRFMSKVQADAFARKRSRIFEGTIQSEKKLAITEVENPYVQKPAPKISSSRNYKTIASTENCLHEPKSLIPNHMEAYSTSKRRSDVIRSESAGS